MNLSMLQTELVACALCAADGKNPDENLPSGEMEMSEAGGKRAVMRKAWQCYETEARKLVLAAETLAKFSQSLSQFRDLAQSTRQTGHA